MPTMQHPDLPSAIPYPVSAISVSGLYRLCNDNRGPVVQRHDMQRDAQHHASTAESGAEQEYVEPQLASGSSESMLSGPDVREELRLDVDGQYPLMLASGTITRRLAGRVHWIANLRASGRFSWSGQIWHKSGDTQLFAYTSVTVTVTRSLHNHQRRATVQFSGGGAPVRTRGFRYASAYFRDIGFELDFVEGVAPVTIIDTSAHMNHPHSLAPESLSIDSVFRRAGFRPREASGSGAPITGAGANLTWSDMEMHDAMQAYWANRADRAQGSLWTLLAARHELGSSLGGIVFEDIGPSRRQGVSVFYDSFVSQAPPGDPQPQAWVDRMRFWATLHGMGHALDLAHSWQKSLPASGAGAWIPTSDESEARSFMNYPFNVTGGQTAFFSDFEFRFSDSELTFMRHAPGSTVATGAAPWFDEHTFSHANLAPERSLKLEVRVNRQRPTFEFLEPIVLELKLTNVSDRPQMLPDDLVSNTAGMTVIVQREGRAARALQPFAHYCRKPGQTVLRTGQSMYDSLFVAADRAGWLLSEPGTYTVQVCLHFGKEDVVSNPMTLRISPACERGEEVVAQDFFTRDMARVLAFDGSRFFDEANDTLNLITERLPHLQVSIHAQVALLMPALREMKRLAFRADGAPPQIIRSTAGTREASPRLAVVLGKVSERAAETLGHIDYHDYLIRFAGAIEAEGVQNASTDAVAALIQGEQTLLKRGATKEAVEPLDLRIRKFDRKTKAA